MDKTNKTNKTKPATNTFATTRLTPVEESMGWRMCKGGCGCSLDKRKVPHAHQARTNEPRK